MIKSGMEGRGGNSYINQVKGVFREGMDSVGSGGICRKCIEGRGSVEERRDGGREYGIVRGRRDERGEGGRREG